MSKCPTCKSEGFLPSVLGPDRCSFCDGTEGGNPPETNPNDVQLPASQQEYDMERREREYQRQLDEEERRANGGGTYSRFNRPEDE